MTRSARRPHTLAIHVAVLLYAAAGLPAPAAAVSTGFSKLSYVSTIDGSTQPYSVYIPSTYDPANPHPVVIQMHGFGGRFYKSAGQFATGESEARGWILASVDGRGNQNYDHIGDDDLIRVFDDIKARYNVDESRVYLTGVSMGGHGCYRLGLRYPDLFAAVAPVAGWTTYLEFYPRWYEPFSGPKLTAYVDPSRLGSLEIASSLWQAENGEYLHMRVAYGTNDTINDPINQTQMMAAYDSFGYTANYVDAVVLGGTHGAGNNTTEIFNFLNGKVRPDAPSHVVYTSNRLRHSGAWWLHMEKLVETDQWTRIEGTITGQQIDVNVANVDGFSLKIDSRYVNMGLNLDVRAGGTTIYAGPPSSLLRFQAVHDASGRITGWAAPPAPAGLLKKPGLEGPIVDAMLGPFVVVYGESGTAQQTAENLEDAQIFAALWNGAMVLRWGSESVPPPRANDWWVPPYPFTTDPDLSAAVVITPITDTAAQGMALTGKNIILFGGPDSNSVTASVASSLPIGLSAGQVDVGGRIYSGPDVRYSIIYPNPADPGQYVLVNRGYLWSGKQLMSWGANNVTKDLEKAGFGWCDYIIWDASLATESIASAGSELRYLPSAYLEAGSFDGSWQLDTAPPTTGHAVTGTLVQSPNFYRVGTSVTLESFDNVGGFGVAGIEYRIDGGAWTPYSGVIPFASTGTFLLEYRATDRGGQYGYAPDGGGFVRSDVTYDNTETIRSVTLRIVDLNDDPPVADAGPDRTEPEGTVAVGLDGTNSYDPNTGGALSYSWLQTGGTAVTLTGASTDTPTFDAPADVTTTQLFTFQLTVIDPTGMSSIDTVDITVTDTEAPVASATGPPIVAGGDVVALDGNASADPDGDTITYLWKQIIVGSEPKVTLNGSDTAQPWFTVPIVTASLTLTFELTVTDSVGLVATVTVTITVTYTDTEPPTLALAQVEISGNVNSPTVASVDVFVGGTYVASAMVVSGTWSYTVDIPATAAVTDVRLEAIDALLDIGTRDLSIQTP